MVKRKMTNNGPQKKTESS